MRYKDSPDQVFLRMSVYKKKGKPNPKVKDYKKKLKDYEYNRNKVFGMLEEMKMMRLLNYKPFCLEFFDPLLNPRRSTKASTKADVPSDVEKGLRKFDLESILYKSETMNRFISIF